MLPRQFEYDPDIGIPANYKRTQKPRTSLLIGGAVIFGAFWITTCLVAGTQLDLNKPGAGALYAPVVGPFIAIFTLPMENNQDAIPVLVLDGVIQAVGVAMFAAGMAYPEQILKYNAPKLGAQLTLQPMVGPTRDGAFSGVIGTF